MSLLKPPIINGKIRFALLGCGRVSNNHFEAIQHYPNACELVAVCDLHQNNLDKVLEKVPNITTYTDLHTMLETGGFDAVIITTPSGLHPIQTQICASYGYNVITEKPMATKYSDAVNMIKACDKAGVRLFVVKQNRSNATMTLLKQAIDSGRFGRIYSVQCNVFWTRTQAYYDSAKWRGTWEFDGGAFMNQASHYVDLLEWLIGPVESVQSYTATLARNIEVEDSGVVALRWRNGALGSMNVSMLTYPDNLEGSITILGETGTVRIGGVAVNKIEKWNFADKHIMDETIDNISYETSSVYGYGHILYYDNVIKTLRGEAEPQIDGREGLKSLELLIAIYLSARDSKKVCLPLDY